MYTLLRIRLETPLYMRCEYKVLVEVEWKTYPVMSSIASHVLPNMTDA